MEPGMVSGRSAFLHFCKLIGLFMLARRLVTRHRLLILCYHGFETTDESAFRPKLFMKAATFARRLDTIRKASIPVLPLGGALDHLHADGLDTYSVAITIDDGFHSTASVALPELSCRDLPAMLYLTTYYVDEPRPVFRLAVQYLFFKTARDHADLSCFDWLSETRVDLRDAQSRQRAAWEIIRNGENRRNEEARRALCIALGQALGVDYETVERSKGLSLLSPDEIVELDRGGVDIQLHTHRHRFPVDDELDAKREICENRYCLESALPEHKYDHFSYPDGTYDESTWDWLSDIGVRSATTCEPGLNDSDTAPLALKRFVDSESIDQIEFEAELYGVLEIARRCRKRVRSIGAAVGAVLGRARASGDVERGSGASGSGHLDIDMYPPHNRAF